MLLIKELGIKERKGGYRERFGLYECPICKKHFETSMKTVKNGKSTKCKSCSISLISRKHLLSKHPLYKKFFDMKTRCCNIKHKAFSRYGARGISICKEWLENPSLFVKWGINNGYEKGLQIDRINPEGNYEPNNCRFVTKYVNAQNKVNINSDRGCSYRSEINRWYAAITHQGKTTYLGTYKNKVDALISYDLFIIDNNTDHTSNGVIPKGFDRLEWEARIKEEIEARAVRQKKITAEDIEYIKQSSKSAYRLSKELPYSKASILKVRRGVY